ncbi:MAG: HAD-IC family P-type ATPase, partial [Ruminococcus sp.]|nr:HAD-IC family P-type ATPase [Ruminococcus sp.]
MKGENALKKEVDTVSVKRIEADENVGLTAEQVRERIQGGLANTPVKPPSKSVGAIIASNVFTYFNFIFAVIAVLLVIAGSVRDLTFLPVIIVNTLIGIVQEIRSKRLLDKMTMLNSPTAKVIRDGQQQSIPSEKLVADDIVIFKAGDQIPADAVVISGKASANEALLTGEADEIVKEKGAQLMSGSFIVSGSCKARLTKVGAESYISQLTLQAKKVKKGEQSEMIRSLNKIVKIAGFIILPLGSLQFYHMYVTKSMDYTQSVRSTMASVIGMIPEGLFLLASVTLAISAMRLARQKVLVHNMKCIETLARTDVLCVDKTGTITENTMQVTGIECIGSLEEKQLFSLLSDFAARQSADN